MVRNSRYTYCCYRAYVLQLHRAMSGKRTKATKEIVRWVFGREDKCGQAWRWRSLRSTFGNSILFYLCIAYDRVEHVADEESKQLCKPIWYRTIPHSSHLSINCTQSVIFSTYSKWFCMVNLFIFSAPIVAIFVLSVEEFIDFDFTSLHASCAFIATHRYATTSHHCNSSGYSIAKT